MPSSIRSAPAAGNALTIASDASASGSPAVRYVTSAARPSALSAAKRLSMRVVMLEMDSHCLLARLGLLPLLAQRGHADIDGAEHQADAHADEVGPFLVCDRRTFGEQPYLEEIDKVERRDDDQQPAGARLPVVQNWPPRCLATLSRSLSPRPERLTTTR